ncbi:MAG: hypothetical protein ABSG33_00470 [Candidatus Bathyarchaeia archaeon]
MQTTENIAANGATAYSAGSESITSSQPTPPSPMLPYSQSPG